MDYYFSADIESDGPIPGPYSMLSFALVFAGSYDGKKFNRPQDYSQCFYRELRPISDSFEQEALDINGLDRKNLIANGSDPKIAMLEAFNWVRSICKNESPVLVAYPISFDWTFLYWYFVNYCKDGSPFGYSQCFDIKTAWSVKSGLPLSKSGRSRIPFFLQSSRKNNHHAIDDATAQAELFANVFEWIPMNENI